VRRYGWRAYALPALAVITVLALITTRSPESTVREVIHAAGGPAAPTPSASAAPTAASNSQLKTDQPAAGSVSEALPALALPPGPAYATRGNGAYTVIAGTSRVIGRGAVRKFSIESENGVTGIDRAKFAAVVMQALSNPQSWIADSGIGLQRVDSGPVDFHISLTSSMTVRALCGYSLPVETSCYDGSQSRVVLNDARWVRGAKVYVSDLTTYRLYAVNHEVGHALGHNHAHDCLKNGLAPVMMQQTIGTKTAAGGICQANPWPYPKGVTDAPGAEQPGDAADNAFFKLNS
jgi:hypothetical protein